ncbi:hypothetical protein MN210_10885 [Psychrobacter raelei]|uniref:Uncharacterized protein n=1 Tax=Psychrobacter raelei TaxID=2565531 RepID=A0AAT9PDP1_9GAMM|nr:hypothetical protein [Psychrobacter sp. PraFG1]UNK04708.1 hypothetical protein MN210_10885 [Psychrobacter sp. PraFG1]
MTILNLNFNLSAVLCIIAAGYGFYILIRHMHITSRRKPTLACDALAVMLGTLAWGTAALEFLELSASYHSPIEVQRIMMVVAWCWLLTRYRYRQ